MLIILFDVHCTSHFSFNSSFPLVIYNEQLANHDMRLILRLTNQMQELTVLGNLYYPFLCSLELVVLKL